MSAMSEIKNIETLKQLKEINFYYYVGLKQAKEKGAPIAYLNALGPIELIYAFDALPCYPENHSVVVQAKRMALETAQAAEAKGWAPDICSYARCDLGYRLSGKSPIGGIPTPDLLVYSSAQCFTLFKWFEELSRMYNVPLFVLDVPGQGRGLRQEPERFAVLYVKEQLYNLIQWLEDKLGQKFDIARFRETVRLSNEAARLFYMVLLAAQQVPAPLTLFDQYLAMAPIVDQRGKQITVDFYRNLVEELKDRIARGIEGVPGEKYRFWWDGLPLWMAMRDFYNILMERKINLVANNYTRAWCQLSFEPKADLDAMLEQYATNLVRSFDPMIRERSFDLAYAIKDYHLNGYLLHSDHSCRFLSLGLMDTLKKVTEMSGIPGLLLDTDHGDPRLYQSEQIRNRLDAYLEMLKPIPR
jgi:benzoyl-CoA reductase/2-hydroxyglutaryl-CoA dehydratase subunit BcrC/BadD/HgdB